MWFATHSLEAVEVTGPESTFVFERQPDTRLVIRPRRLAGRPVLSALSAAIGSPAFSLARLRFVFVEGDRQTRERERFYAVCGEAETNRFLEGGGCDEVLRRLTMIAELAGETEEQLRVGGVIDRDFRSDEDVLQLEARAGVHVLGCHEIENVFLDPASIAVLLQRAGGDPSEALTLIRDVSDRYAGLWIVDYAASRHTGQMPRAGRVPIASRTWSELSTYWTSLKAQSLAAFDPVEQSTWGETLETARAELALLRSGSEWWRRCLGKQTLSSMAPAIGLSSGPVLEQHVVKLWEGQTSIPQDVIALRQYVAGLSLGP